MDGSASMTYASGKVSKLEYAKFLAATLAYIVLKQRDSVGLSIFDSEVRAYLPPRSAMGIILQIDRLLREINSEPKNTISKQLHDIALMLKRRSFVVVISDFFAYVDDILAGLDHLRFDGHNVVVRHTLAVWTCLLGMWLFGCLSMGAAAPAPPTERAGAMKFLLDRYRHASADKRMLQTVTVMVLEMGHDGMLADLREATRRCRRGAPLLPRETCAARSGL